MEIDSYPELTSTDMLAIIRNTCELYMKYGARSSKKVDYFHEEIIKQLRTIFTDKSYKVAQEYDVPSLNPSGKKKCDLSLIHI